MLIWLKPIAKMENNLAQTCYVVNPGISLGISYIKAANRVSMGIQNVISTLLLQQTVLLSTSMGRTYYKRASLCHWYGCTIKDIISERSATACFIYIEG